MGNDALRINPNTNNGGTADIAITTHGSNWLWAVTAVMIVSTLAFIGLSFGKPRTHRIFHYITASITLVAAISYFSMASNLGWTPIRPQFIRSNPKVSGLYREIFYVRYIDWFITTPLLLLDLLLTAGLPWPTILFTILMDEVMIVTGLVGALVRSSYKWGFFVFGMVALLFVAWQVTWVGRKHANALGTDVSRTYLICGCWTIFLWFLYPIAWGLCEGGNVIAPDSEAVFYGILDILAKPVFGALLLWGHRTIDPNRLGIHIRDYDDVPRVDGPLHQEKHHNGAGPGITGAHHSGVTDTTTTTVGPTTTV
ncbi:ion channel activity [Acarospora aff. strigata]|nr:ion channel activity [Acarospora aff. strigata]